VDTHRAQIARDIVQLGGEGLSERIMVDTTLIGGYEVRVKGKCLDRTYKHTLIGMYENFITR
jgi:F0F1-type ATP synthase delta subunit